MKSLTAIAVAWELQSQTELLENVLSLMRTTLRNKTNSKSTALRQETPLPQFNVACYELPGTRLSYEDTSTPLPEGGGETLRLGCLEKFSVSIK